MHAIRAPESPISTARARTMALCPARHRRILLCLRYGIGDVVMELPLIEALRSVVPEAKLTVLGAHPAIELLEASPAIDRCVSLQQLGITHRWDRGSKEARRRIDRWLSEARFDLAIDSRHAPPAVTVPVYEYRIPRVDSDPDAEREAVAAGKNAVAAIQEAVAAGWGIEVQAALATPRYHPRAEDRRFADDLLRRAGARNATVGVAPVASHALKRWPAERFAELADWLIRSLDAHLLVFCGPDGASAQPVLDGVAGHRSCTVIGALHLGKVSALLSRCAILVANDTGITHVAAAVGTPTVGIFGPTAPRIYRPAGDAAVSVGGEAVECRHRNERSLEPPGCWYGDRCLLGGAGCIRHVEVAAVQRAVQKVLAIPGAARSRRAGTARLELVPARPDPS